MIRRIFQLVAIAWCVTAIPAVLADESAPGAGQDSSGTAPAAASAPAQAAPATTAQNNAADDEKLKVFGFMPLHKPQPPATPDSSMDQAPAQTAPDEAKQPADAQAAQTGQQPTAADQAAPAAAEAAHEQTPAPAPAAASETPPPAQPPAAATDQAATADKQASDETPAAAAPTTPAPAADAAQETPKAEKEDHAKAQPQDEASAQTPHKASHWSYSGAGAPQFWGELKPEFATCGNGKQQSPIDISTATVTTLPKLQFDYHATPLRVVNNGHSIQLNYQHGSAVILDGKRYELIQVHFHTPSEHTMGGKAYPMVAHLVHKSAGGQLLVVAVLMQTGKSNPLIARIWRELPSAAGQIKVADEQSVNMADLLPKDGTYFTYTGSLTTPPCTEGVKWVVLSAPVKVSQIQVDKFAALFPHNARPVKPLNGRTVLFSN